MRKLVRVRRGGLLAVVVAYALAIQALMTSVGLGMSAFAAPAQSDLVICRHISSGLPASGSDNQNPGPAPQCPFCLVAAYSAGDLALIGQPPGLPHYASLPVVLADDHFRAPALAARRHRTVGVPRAPPAASV